VRCLTLLIPSSIHKYVCLFASKSLSVCVLVYVGVCMGVCVCVLVYVGVCMDVCMNELVIRQMVNAVTLLPVYCHTVT